MTPNGYVRLLPGVWVSRLEVLAQTVADAVALGMVVPSNFNGLSIAFTSATYPG